MIEAGVLYAIRDQEGQQRNVGLKLNREAGRTLGIELSSEGCRGVLTDVDVRPLKRIFKPSTSRGVDEMVEVIVSVARELLEGEERPLLGTVIGVPGICDVTGQNLLVAESLGWSSVPLAGMLSERLPCRVSLINRTKAATLGERWYGAGIDEDNLIYVSVSSGIAAGILVEGQLLSGADGMAGELGHTCVLIEGGRRCVCGSTGCLETVASVPAIWEAIQARVQEGETNAVAESVGRDGGDAYQKMLEAARNGDPLVLEEVRTACRYLGVAVANLINILSPRLVIIGGQLAEIGEMVVNTVRSEAQRRAFAFCFANVEIVGGSLGLDAVCMGACASVVDQYLARAGG
jgi:glucokinase